MTRLRVAFALLCLSILSDLPVHSEGGQYVESFNTTTYKDAVNTTANWDTGTGELKLHVFTPSIVGSYDTPGSAASVVVEGNLAFVADQEFGLRVVDITNPASPTPVGLYDTPGLALHLDVDGDLAFVADESGGLKIISIANPVAPTLVGTYVTAGAAGVTVDGNLAFVAAAFDGLRIVDITNPAIPTLVGSYNTPGIAVSVDVEGDLAYVADQTAGLHIVNINNPASPTLVGTYNTPGNATGVAVAGDRAFVSDGASGVQVLNVSNPASPTLVATYNTPGFANGIVVTGDIAYVADDATGLVVLDITNPSSPVLDVTFDTPGLALGVAVAGEHAFIADESSGLQVAKVWTVARPRQVGAFAATFALDVAVAGDYAFVAGANGGLRIIDITNTANPTLLGSHGLYVRSVAIAGDLVVASRASEGLATFDIADPTNPTLLGQYNTPGNAWDLALAGNLALVADDASGLQIIDITNPSSPALVGTYDTPGTAYNLEVARNLAFVADDSGLQVIDFTNPSSPTLAGTLDPPPFSHFLDVALSGDLAFVAASAAGLQVVDITNPAAPLLIGSLDTSGSEESIAVSGDIVFMGSGGWGILVIDVANPTNPTAMGYFDTVGRSYRVAVAGDLCFVADGDEGLVLGEVFNPEFYTWENVGRSLQIDATSDPVVAARIESTESPGVTWELSADDGTSWQSITPDNVWNPIAVEGSDLVWRSTHTTTTPGVNPTVSDLQVEWLYEFALIDAIADIPDDQGGWVRLNYTRSGRDFAAEPLPIIHYGVWRRVDDAALSATLASTPRDAQAVDPAIAKDFEALPLFQHAGRTFVESPTREVTGTLPPGTWEWVATLPALQQPSYLAAVPTVADAPAQVELVVTAHTTTPSIWYTSQIALGSSVDNIAPGVPTGFAIAYNTGSGNALSWDPAPEEDFQYFRVYRSTDPGFTPSPGTLVHSTAITGWSDPDHDGGAIYYKITALDHAGNESGPATAGTVTSIGGTHVPEKAALYQNHPNPFNPTTQIRYDVPRGGAEVELAVYDVSGRRVRVLVAGRESEGTKSIGWDARDDGGAPVATGVYFYRVTIGDFAGTRKMVLLK